MEVHMKSKQLLSVKEEPVFDDQTILEILNVLELRHDLVNEQWHALKVELESLNEERTPNDTNQKRMADQGLLMEQELSRYQRFFQILRQSLKHSKNAGYATVAC